MKQIYFDSSKSYEQRSDTDLDCSGDDSGSSDCWAQWVNIWIPTISSILFVVILIVFYVIKPKVPERYDQENVMDDEKSITDHQLTEVFPHTTQLEGAPPYAICVQPAFEAVPEFSTQTAVETESVTSRL